MAQSLHWYTASLLLQNHCKVLCNGASSKCAGMEGWHFLTITVALWDTHQSR